DPPPGDARPRDPDATGGFYQPIIVRSAAGDAVHLQRLVCNPRSAPVDVAREFFAMYRTNQNPAAPTLVIDADIGNDRDAGRDAPAAEGDAAPIAADTRVALSVAWRPEDAEAYVWIDPVTATLQTRRESMLVSWFATAGSFARDRSEVAEGDASTGATNTWQAPLEPGPVVFWAVLRDSRGGTAFVERTISVE
ncbi:MAG TPA: hypothetical protein VMG12_02860, partial [Polyangiaceae bacterium]|nr:hypothetical protein [Polyangiaceae bacterium]